MRMFLTTSKKVASRIALSMVALAFLIMGMLFSVACFNRIEQPSDPFERNFHYLIDAPCLMQDVRDQISEILT